LGVHTFQDLAARSCAEIISQLKEKDQPAPSESDCQDWINQAKELAKAEAAKKKWKPIASFVVEFLSRLENGGRELKRTKVHYVEADQEEKWERIASKEPCNWMLEQAARSDRASAAMKQHIDKVRNRAQRDLQEEIEEVRREALKELEKEQALARAKFNEDLEEERMQAGQELEEELNQKRIEQEEELEKYRRRFQEEMERRLAADHAQALERLQKELAEQRKSETEELEEQLQSTRAQREKAMAEDMEKKQQEAEQALAQELEEARKKGRQELAEAQAKAAQEMEKEFETQRAEMLADLKEELAQERESARKEIEEQLAADRAEARAELERTLYEMRSQVMLELEQKIAEGRLPVEAVSVETAVDEEPEPEPEAQEAVQPAPPAPRLILEPIDLPYIALKIDRVRAFQPAESSAASGTGIPGESFSGVVNGSETFAIKVDLELAEPPASEALDPRITYTVQVFARNRATGAKTHLGDSRRASFSAGQTAYSANFSNVTLAAGSYDLVLFVSIQDGRQIADYAEVSLFQVA
ncbi:MAG: hypothetical protein R3293_22005, partial [Candidatus Promineifilaceae bacterium]|nr:hypothetical protein [Candidatus Promineifilaceae bacterium]